MLQCRLSVLDGAFKLKFAKNRNNCRGRVDRRRQERQGGGGGGGGGGGLEELRSEELF